MLPLYWVKCEGDVWCKLNTVNLNHSHFDDMKGVYIIWRGGQNAATVYVGQGDIKDRLQYHRSNQQIQVFKDQTLYVTWARVQSSQMDGVEAYLSRRLGPLVVKQYPNVNEIEVSLPW